MSEKEQITSSDPSPQKDITTSTGSPSGDKGNPTTQQQVCLGSNQVEREHKCEKENIRLTQLDDSYITCFSQTIQ